MNKEGINKHAKLYGVGDVMRPEAYTKVYRQLRKAGSNPQGREHQLFVQCQMAIPKSIHTSTNIWTHRLYFRICMYIQIHICIQ